MYSTIITVLLIISGVSFIILLAKYVKVINKGQPIFPSIEEKDHSPILLCVRNMTKERKKAIMFGFNKFESEVNYGSDIGIEVLPAISSVTYGQILRDSAICPFDVGLITIVGTTEQDVKNLIQYHIQDINGQSATTPIIMDGYLKEQEDRNIKSILNVPFGFQINAGAYLEVVIPPDTTIVYKFYPIRKYSLRGFLNAFKITLPSLRRGITPQFN